MRSLRFAALPGLVDRASFLLAIAAGILLVAMVGVITAGVGARYFLGRPILGINEIVQMNAVALAMLAMPYCTASQAHVRADIFDRLIGRWGRLAGDIVTRLLSIAALSVLVHRSWDKMLDAREFGDATNMLALPLWPFHGLIAFGMALCVLVFAAQILRIVLLGEIQDV